ncbi:ABC transporter permease [uncultured Exiguobacterium sp.]|uniref:ABC transporter permease n=1 Tax=uncultured Exiguobacterium sp. TaxID=202669 RepID=UPI0037492FFB
MKIRKYTALMRSQIKVDLAYTAWYWASMFSVTMRLFILYFFWQAVYANKTDVSGISLSTMLTYAVLATMIDQFRGGAGRDLARMIKQGAIAIELLRPYHLLDKLLAQDIGSKVSILFRSILPLVLVSILFIGVDRPQSWLAGIAFVGSVLCAVLLATLIDLLVGIFAFYTVNIWGLSVLQDAVITIMSGAIVPLTLFPDWFQTISLYLPFASLVYVPVAIYTGEIAASGILQALLVQIGWMIGFFVILRITFALAIRKVTVFGG